MPSKYKMGSPDWANQVFTDGPVRKLKGHSKATQYHGYHSTILHSKMEMQGRNECGSALAIEYLITRGLISRVKAQPFTTEAIEFGYKITPDFLAEGTDAKSTLYVIETKSARYYTPAVMRRHEEFRKRFQQYGMSYIVWTSEYPINRWLKHNLINMRKAACAPEVQDQDISDLIQWVGSRRGSQATVGNMYGIPNLNREVLWAAAWHGKVFYSLTSELTRNTLITLAPVEDHSAIFLNRQYDWWDCLKMA